MPGTKKTTNDYSIDELIQLYKQPGCPKSPLLDDIVNLYDSDKNAFIEIIKNLTTIAYQNKARDVYIFSGTDNFAKAIILRFIEKHDGQTIRTFIQGSGPLTLSVESQELLGIIKETVQKIVIQSAKQSQRCRGLSDKIQDPNTAMELAKRESENCAYNLYQGVEKLIENEYDNMHNLDKAVVSYKTQEPTSYHFFNDNIALLFKDYSDKANWRFFHAGRKHKQEARELENSLHGKTTIQQLAIIKEKYHTTRNNPFFNHNGSFVRRLKYAQNLLHEKTKDQRVAHRDAAIENMQTRMGNDKEWFNDNANLHAVSDNANFYAFQQALANSGGDNNIPVVLFQ